MTPYIYPGVSPEIRAKALIEELGISDDKIFEAIEKVLGITQDKIQSKTRKREFVTARFIFVGLKKAYGKYSTLVNLGKVLGNRNHASIIYYNDTFKDLLEVRDKKFTRYVDLVKKELGI